MTDKEQELELAFPCATFGQMGDVIHQQGMSLRDWYAGMAMQGQLSCREHPLKTDGSYHSEDPLFLANGCYRIADAMIKAKAGEES